MNPLQEKHKSRRVYGFGSSNWPTRCTWHHLHYNFRVAAGILPMSVNATVRALCFLSWYFLNVHHRGQVLLSCPSCRKICKIGCACWYRPARGLAGQFLSIALSFPCCLACLKADPPIQAHLGHQLMGSVSALPISANWLLVHVLLFLHRRAAQPPGCMLQVWMLRSC